MANVRLARTPSMFGDFFAPPIAIEFSEGGSTGQPGVINADLPIGGALRRAKISDNGRALPTDRVYFLYNHFANAIERSSVDSANQFLGPLVRESVDKYTVGYEKTFFSGGGSIELRVPFTSPTDIDLRPQFDTAINVPGQEFGNVNVAFKALVTETDNFASAIGIGVDIPTAEDVNGTIDPQPPGSSSFPGDLFRFHIENETVYLQPFVAAVMTPSDDTFIQGFLIVDVPTGGDEITFTDPFVGTTNLGRVEDATLLHADVALGRWIFQDSPGVVSGLASIVEFHYTPMLEDPNVIAGNAAGNTLAFGQSRRLEFVDVTIGLHAQLGENTSLRVGGVFPLLDRPDRTFDAELLVQLDRYLR